MEAVIKLIQRIVTEEAIRLFSKPTSIFRELKPDSWQHNMIRTAVYSLIAAILAFLWGLVRLNLQYGLLNFITILTVGFAVVWIGGLVLMYLNRLLKGNDDFNFSLTVSAWFMAFYPGALVVSALIQKTKNLGILANLVYSLFFLYTSYQALLYGCKADKIRINILFGIILLYMIVSLFIMY